MVKRSKQSATSRANGKSRKNRRSVSVSANRPKGLDSAAMDYARLLMDPCNARLTHPIYAGSGAGYLTRVQKVFTLSNSDANGSISLAFTPGQLSNAATGGVSAANGIGSVLRTLYNSTAMGYQVYNDRDLQPGYAFFAGGLSPNVSVRPVAACLKARYVGTELNRGGSVYTGYLPQGDAYFSENPSSAPVNGVVTSGFNTNLATAAQFSTRMPDGSVEVKWAPSRADMRFRDLTSAVQLVADEPTHATSFFVAQGLPANTNIEFTLTAVYEWQPNLSTGLVQPISTTKSTLSLDAVLGYLSSFGNWIVSPHPTATFTRSMVLRAAMGASGLAGAGYPRIEL